MADFAAWVVAASGRLGMTSNEFLKGYEGNREAANEIPLEESPVTEHIRRLAPDGINSSATEILAKLNEQASDESKRLQSWPKSPRALGGTLRRLAPHLRGVGINVEFHKGGEGSRRSIVINKLR
jgi:hypothetical protein